MEKYKVGLTNLEVKKSKEKYGDNTLNKMKSNSFWELFLESLGDPIIRILLIALGIKTIFLIKDFDWYETVGIVIAILLASLISSISEYGSEKAFKKLQEDASKTKCKVKRNGKLKEILIDDVVKDDIIVLEAGDMIPADGIIVKGELDVDESSLNGETKEVHKDTKNNKVYRGTTVYSKKALVKVSEVGNNTVYGKMNLELQEKSPTSPLKLRLNKLALVISKIGYIGAFLVSFSYLFSSIVIENNFDLNKISMVVTNFHVMMGYILYALTLAVTIIVVAVPEGLPMMITLVLSSNMKRMLKNNVLVRKLVGIETAGSINILFTDKTGTLTKGKFEVTEIATGNLQKYNSEAELLLHPNYHNLVSRNIIYNNESSLENGSIIGGNITDRALLSFIHQKTTNIEVLEKVPFDSKNKYSTALIKDLKKIHLIKGASEKILPYCKSYYNENGQKIPLLNKNIIENYIKKISSNGSRVLLLAEKEYWEKELTLVGIVSIKDDLRKDAKKGIELVKNAGIQTVMLTGDNIDTARAIGKDVGLLTNENDLVITSNELNAMSENEIINILPKLKIVARSLPSDKTKLIKLSRKCNLVVGMTGDGVNDAPALKNADVGFAMGSGTEASIAASDIVILDDNFLSIANAVLYGRTIFKSIRKFIICQLTINLCAIFLSFVCPFIGIDTPVTVIQMLWINMVMDTLTALAFSFEPALLEYMQEKPKKKDESIINSYMLGEIFFTGIYASILCILFLKLDFFKGIYRNDYKYLMSAFFGLFIFINIFNSFNARTHRLNIFSNILKNKVFLAIVIFIVAVQLLLIYYGGSLFRTIGLTFKELQFMIIVAATIIPVDFIRKLILRKKNIIGGV